MVRFPDNILSLEGSCDGSCSAFVCCSARGSPTALAWCGDICGAWLVTSPIAVAAATGSDTTRTDTESIEGERGEVGRDARLV